MLTSSNGTATGNRVKKPLPAISKPTSNHPSIIAFGPEGEANRVPGITHMFPWYKQVLRKSIPSGFFPAPRTLCVWHCRLDGEWAIASAAVRVPVNSAGVNAGGLSMNVVPFTLTPFTARWCNWNWVNQALHQPDSVIATEALFYGVSRYTTVPRLWAWYTNTYAPLVRGGRVDLEQQRCAHVLVRLKADAASGSAAAPAAVHQGRRDETCADRARIFTAVGERVKQYIELARISDDYLQGFGSVLCEMFDYRPAGRFAGNSTRCYSR